MRAKAQQVVAWVKEAIRTLRAIPRAVGRWLRSHASHCVASVWLSGIAVFGATTTKRVIAAQVPEEAVAEAAAKPEAVEVVEMLDVDEMNAIRDRRMHAHGLAAADGVGPDDKMIQAAREAQARNIEIDGERVATAGNIAVVTRGGIAGWLKRNRGKKADPETLAWLRGEEAAEGRESYAGWADREDGNVLNWAKEKRRAMRAAQGSGAGPGEDAAGAEPSHTGGDMVEGNAGATTIASTDGAGAPLASTNDAVSSGAPAPSAAAAAAAPAPSAAALARASADSGPAALTPTTDVDAAARGAASPAPAQTARVPSLAVQGISLVALGGAATRALLPHAPTDPPAGEIAALREQLQTIGSGAIAVSLRDHRVLLTLLCDQLFAHDRPELSERGTQVVRGLSRLLAGDRGHAYNVAVDRERAFELLSNLAIAGLPPERVDLALKKRDSAIDVVEVEWIDVKETR